MVAMADNSHTLDLDRRLEFHQREWRIQRIGWALWAAALLAGFAGLFGSGPLSDAEAVHADASLRVQYDRFWRCNDVSFLRIIAAAQDGEVRLRISQEYLDRVKVERIVPEPVERVLDDHGATLVFRTAPNVGQATILLYVETRRPGVLNGQIRRTGETSVRFRQYVYP
jgi:hypothetical protein